MKNSVGKNATILTITKIVNLSVSMISVMLLSRYRTLEEYGTYSQLNMVVALFTTFIMMGLPGSINYFIAKTESNKERKKFLSNFYSISTMLSFITGIILFIGTPIIAKYFDNKLIYIFSFYLLLIPWIKIIESSIGNLFIVYNKVKYLTLYNIGYSLIMLLVLILSIVFYLSFVQYMYIIVITQIIFTLLIYFIASKLVGGIRLEFDTLLIKEMLKFSIPLGLAMIVATIHIEMDKLIIGYFFNTETLAIYTNAAKEMPVTIISSSITAILLPHIVKLISKNKINQAIKLWKDSITFSFIFMSFFTCALFVFAPQIISILYSDKYLPGTTIFRIYTIVLLFRTTYFGMLLNSLGKTKLIMYMSIVGMLLNVIFNFVFFYLFGINGPAIATVVSMFIGSAIYMILNSKIAHVGINEILSIKELLKIILINIFLAAIVMIICNKINLGIDNLEIIKGAFIGIIWLICYIIILYKKIKEKWILISSDDVY